MFKIGANLTFLCLVKGLRVKRVAEPSYGRFSLYLIISERFTKCPELFYTGKKRRNEGEKERGEEKKLKHELLEVATKKIWTNIYGRRAIFQPLLPPPMKLLSTPIRA
jgi:hypothetical protein